MSLEAEEAHCRERLAEIRLRCEQESKPWLDRLARIYACRPPRIYFVIPEVGSAAFQRMTAPKQDRPAVGTIKNRFGLPSKYIEANHG